MAAIDIIILTIIGTGVVAGFMKGPTHQLTSTLGLVVGLLAAKALYATLVEKLCPVMTDSITVAQVLAFIVIWIAIPLMFILMASLLAKAMRAISPGQLSRWLGSGLRTLKFLLLTSLVICVIESTGSDSRLVSTTKKSESLLYYLVGTLAGILFSAAKNITQQYVLDNKDTTRRTQ